jgi:hypothetical protein
MTIPSWVLGSGVNSLSAVAICGTGQDDIVAAGATSATATQLQAVYNSVDTVAAGTGVKLLPTEAGMTIFVVNSGAHTLTVYPYEAATTINGLASHSLDKDHTAIYFAVTNSIMYTISGTKT